jgi:hypothetical protein
MSALASGAFLLLLLVICNCRDNPLPLTIHPNKAIKRILEFRRIVFTSPKTYMSRTIIPLGCKERVAEKNLTR